MAITTQTEDVYRQRVIYSKTDSTGVKYSYGSDLDNVTFGSIAQVRNWIDSRLGGTLLPPTGAGTSSLLHGVVVNIVVYGSGVVNTSSGGQSLQNRASITVTPGNSVYFQAVPAPGYRFQDWTSQDGAKSTSNPFTATVTRSGTMSATFVPEKGTGAGTAGSTCTKGQVVPAVLGAKFLGCGEGYTFVPAATTDIFNTGYCVCNEYLKSQEGQAWAQNIKGQGQEAGQSLTAIITYLPYLIIGAIVIAVLGMFKK